MVHCFSKIEYMWGLAQKTQPESQAYLLYLYLTRGHNQVYRRSQWLSDYPDMHMRGIVLT
jgi:hypothetical protein